MKYAKYVGDPNDDDSGPKVLNVKGVEFTKGEITEVSDDLHDHLAKHSHFDAEVKPVVKPVPPKVDPAK